MSKFLNIIILFTLLILSFENTYSQNNQRPKVAVVLSGGGAKGFTHIGVLKVLEQEGIPIDIIVGTSIGGIVGGLYSIGYSADEIATLSLEENWSRLLTDHVSRKQLDQCSKINQQRYVLNVPISFNKKPGLPSGLVNGQNLLNLFCGLTANVPKQAEFKDFPISFACVGTDLSKGKEIIMDSGFLPTAIFSSMAIPGVFAPGNHNGYLLVDGGMVDNFPTDVAKKMGADIIIGVDIRPDLFQTDEINSVDKLFGQLVAFYSLSKDSLNKSFCNVIIRPNLEGYNSASFQTEAVDTLIRRGMEATNDVVDKIRTLKAEFNLQPKQVSSNLTKIKEWKISDVKINGNHSMSEKLLMDVLNLSLPGEYNYSDIKKSIDNLYGMGVFKRVYFSISENDQGKTFNINIEEKKAWDVNIGMRVNTQNFVSLAINSTRRDYSKTFGLLSFSADISSNPKFNILAEIDNKKFPKLALMAEGSYSNLDIHLSKEYAYPAKLYTGSLKLYTYQQVLRHSTIGAGIKSEHYIGKIYTAINDSNIQISNSKRLLTHLYGYYSFDNLDDYYFPEKGSESYSELSLAEDLSFTKFNPILLVKSRSVLNVNNNIDILLSGFARSVFMETTPSFLGNFVAAQDYEISYNQHATFYGLPTLWSTGRTTLIGRAGIRMNYRQHYITFTGNYLLHNNKILQFSNYKSILGFGLTYAYKSAIGPLEFTLGYSDKYQRVIASANIGFWF